VSRAPVTINFEKLSAVVAKLGSILFKESKIDVITGILNEISKLYGCKKATFFAVSTTFQQCFNKGIKKDQQKNVFKFEY
jgi:hypothetical protein